MKIIKQWGKLDHETKPALASLCGTMRPFHQFPAEDTPLASEFCRIFLWGAGDDYPTNWKCIGVNLFMVAKLKQKEIHFIAFSKNSLTFYFFQGKSVGHFSCRDITYSAIRFSYVVKSQCAFSLSHLLLCLLSLQLIFAVRFSHGLIPPFRLNFRRSPYSSCPITHGRNLAWCFDSSLDLQISSFRFQIADIVNIPSQSVVVFPLYLCLIFICSNSSFR